MVDEKLAEPLLRWIPFLPLAAALLHAFALGVVWRPLTRIQVAVLSLGAPVLSLAIAAYGFARLVTLPSGEHALYDVVYTWLGAGIGDAAFSSDVAFQLDPLSAVLALVVAGVGLAVHVHALESGSHADRDDRSFQRWFASLNWTLGSVLVLVLADNLLFAAVGWQSLSLGVWLLTGFGHGEASHARAATRVFVTQRVGDVALIVAVLLLFWALSDAGTPTLTYRGVEAAFAGLVEHAGSSGDGTPLGIADVVGLCLFVAAAVRGGQIPFQLWLRDEVSSPPAASALVQGVAAAGGVYLMCRLSFLFAAAPVASAVVAWAGGLTALLMAIAAAAQRDLRAVLAYSTASQLGLAFLAVGSGAFAAAIFHVVTHAFVKSLLFLGAATVITAMRGERDLRRMGGLRKRLPKVRFLVGLGGVLVLAAAPGSAIFFSAEEILMVVHRSALPGHGLLYGTVIATVLLTAFYALRCQLLAFEGDSRVEREVRAHMHEPDNLALAPLYALVLLSVFASLLGFPQFWGSQVGIEDSNSLANFLMPILATAPAARVSAGTEWALVFAVLAASTSGGGIAWYLYVRNPRLRERLRAPVETLTAFVRSGYGMRELVDGTVLRPLLHLADHVLHRGVEQGVIDSVVVEGTGRSVRALTANALRQLQSGVAQGYLVVVVVGMLGILLYLVR